MTTIFERVKTALNTLSPAVPHALAPYKGATLPDTYIVYQLLPSTPEQHADNVETERSYIMQVTTWSKAGLINLPNVKAAMLAAGFHKSGERQLPQDQATGHYGLATDYMYLESEE
jgi:hypothetical protein